MLPPDLTVLMIAVFFFAQCAVFALMFYGARIIMRQRRSLACRRTKRR